MTIPATLSDLFSQSIGVEFFLSEYCGTSIPQSGEAPSFREIVDPEKSVIFVLHCREAFSYLCTYLVGSEKNKANQLWFVLSAPYHKMFWQYCYILDSRGFSRLQTVALCLMTTPMLWNMQLTENTILPRNSWRIINAKSSQRGHSSRWSCCRKNILYRNVFSFSLNPFLVIENGIPAWNWQVSETFWIFLKPIFIYSNIITYPRTSTSGSMSHCPTFWKFMTATTHSVQRGW